MTNLVSKLPIYNAVCFFIFWSLALYAIADHPPPRGFYIVVLLVLLCALVIFWRTPYYVRWMTTRRPNRRLMVVADGLLAGCIIGILSIGATLIFTGEPGVSPRPADIIIWIAVLSVLGVLNSTGIYFVNWLILRFIARPTPLRQ